MISTLPMNITKHLIDQKASVKEALIKLNDLGADAILFVADENTVLIGSLTDGDLRRGFIKGLTFENAITEFIQPNPIFVYKNKIDLADLEWYKQQNLKIIPVIDDRKRIVDIINLRFTNSVLPVNAVIMAGGRGQRLMPLTANCPKPLLKVGSKPIIEHNIDRLIRFGISHLWISINYLGHALEEYFGDGNSKNVHIKYIKETTPLGTIGSIKLVNDFDKDEILILNSDLLTNVDFADFYSTFRSSGADMAVASIGDPVDIPYAVLELDGDNTITSLREKPRYTYYSNAGIYLIKKELLDMIPQNQAHD